MPKELRATFREDPIMNEILERSSTTSEQKVLEKTEVKNFITAYQVRYLLIDKKEKRFQDLKNSIVRLGIKDSILSEETLIYQLH